MIATMMFAAGQVLVPPPAPPMLPRADTAGFLQERSNYADRLRHDCMSEPGIVIILRAWEARRRAGSAQVAAQAATERELGEAAYASPVDPDRLARAMTVKRELNDATMAEIDASNLATLRQLSPADRGIYARGMTYLRPEIPPRICQPAGASK